MSLTIPMRTFTIIDEKTLETKLVPLHKTHKDAWGKRIIIFRDFSAPKENMLPCARYSNENKILGKIKNVYSSTIPQGFKRLFL